VWLRLFLYPKRKKERKLEIFITRPTCREEGSLIPDHGEREREK